MRTRALLLLLLLAVIPTLVWGDAATDWTNCWDVPIPGTAMRPCLHFGMDTCGDIGLHGWFVLANRNTSFTITNPDSLNVCFSTPGLFCNQFCLRLDRSTFRLTHSYASFTPYIAISSCPVSRFPANPTTYYLGVDCDARSNTTCDQCTSMSDQGTCAWCPTTGVCIATSNIATSLCDGINMCPVEVQHLGMCITPPPTPTPNPTPTPAPTDPPTEPPATDACSNPMFMGTLQVTGSRLHLLPAPAVLNGASCPNLSGKAHCCAWDTFDQWKHMMGRFDQAAIIAAGDHGDLKLDDLLRMLNNVTLLPPFPNPTPYQTDQLNQLLNIFKLLDQPLQTCARAIVAYWNGLMCFSCHSDWRTYYNPDTQQLRLNVSTCDAASQGCAPVLELVNSKRKDLMQIMVNLYESSGDNRYNQIISLMKTAISLDRLIPHICQVGWRPATTCREVVCNQFLHGLDYNFTLPSLQPPLNTNHMHTQSLSSSSSPSVNPISWLVPSLTSHQPMSHVQSILGFLVTWIQHVHITTTKQHIETIQVEPTGGHAINTYVMGGYPVNEIGCAAQMSTQACLPIPVSPPTQPPTQPSGPDNGGGGGSTQSDASGSKSNTGLIIGIIVGIALGVIALVGLVCYIRKRRSTTRIPPHRRLQDEDFGIGGVPSPDGNAYSRFDPRL